MHGTASCRRTFRTVPPKSTIDDGRLGLTLPLLKGLGTAGLSTVGLGLSTAGLGTAYNSSHQTSALHQVNKSTGAQHVASLEDHTD